MIGDLNREKRIVNAESGKTITVSQHRDKTLVLDLSLSANAGVNLL